MNTILLVIILLVIVTIAVWIVMKYYNKKITTEKFEDLQTKPKLILFHASWCKYCVEYLADTKYNGKNAFDAAGDTLQQQINFDKLDVDENKELVNQYGVSSFPSIVGVETSGSVQQFSGDRDDLEGIIAFAKTLT